MEKYILTSKQRTDRIAELIVDHTKNGRMVWKPVSATKKYTVFDDKKYVIIKNDDSFMLEVGSEQVMVIDMSDNKSFCDYFGQMFNEYVMKMSDSILESLMNPKKAFTKLSTT